MTVDEARRLIELCREVDKHGRSWSKPDPIIMWRAGFGALLEIAENSLTCEMEYEATLRFLAPLAAWADREHEGWRTR